MNLPKPNRGKKLTITIGGVKYARYPIRTHIVSEKDKIGDVVEKYAVKFLRNGDVIVISERVVAITQGRAIPIDQIHPSLAARTLVRFVYKPSWGIGIGSPWTMEIAIREAGLWRILLAATVSAITRPFGVRGLFYKIVGHGVNAIDGPTSYTLPPGNKCATLGPKEPEKVAQNLKSSLLSSKSLDASVVIIDANDIGCRIEGASAEVDRDLVCKIFKDNPLGQAHEQTPMAIVRKIS